MNRSPMIPFIELECSMVSQISLLLLIDNVVNKNLILQQTNKIGGSICIKTYNKLIKLAAISV